MNKTLQYSKIFVLKLNSFLNIVLKPICLLTKTNFLLETM